MSETDYSDGFEDGFLAGYEQGESMGASDLASAIDAAYASLGPDQELPPMSVRLLLQNARKGT